MMINMDYPHPELDFFGSKHRPYYIATGEWSDKSMGFRVPFLLCHALNELGYEAYVIAQNHAPNLRTPLLTSEIVQKHKRDKRETIAVYTEAMWGNTLYGDVVVQWMLNKSGRIVNNKRNQSAIHFYWDKSYAQSDKDVHILRLPCIDESVFNISGTESTKRDGFAYYAHKYLREGKGVIAEEIVKSGISLCHDIPRSQEEIASILRSVSVLYCYEDSVIMVEAALCGCTVVLIETDFMTGIIQKQCSEYCDHIVSIHDIDINKSYPYTGIIQSNYDKEYKTNSQSYLAKFIKISQNAHITSAAPCELIEYCNGKNNVFIYGAGLIGGLMHNILLLNGVDISGFIVSDEHLDSGDCNYLSLPVFSLTQYVSNCSEGSGLLLAISKGNALQVTHHLSKQGVSYFGA